jgi:chromosome segregation ATPase
MYEGSKFTYDERKKELRASKVWLMKGEKEIKKQIEDLNKQLESYKKQEEKLKEILNIPEMDDELKEFKRKIEILQKIELKEKEGPKIEENLKNCQEDMKAIKSDLDQLKKEVGSRIKL